mgnify:CR=1 FL=1
MKRKLLCVLLCLLMCVSMLAGCGGKKGGKPDALVVMLEQPDGLFNPFFYTAANDGTVVSMTQIGMLTTGYENGEVIVACGDKEAVVVKDYAINYDAASDKTIVPELQNSLPLPSFRLITSQKKTQQNLINNILLKRFSSEVQPTKNYNIKYSYPLSSKDDLIVIVRHLII